MSFDSIHSAPDDQDLIVIGGGIQGVMLALEASHRGLRVLLLDSADWGGGTTYNWLRILHGGLRYLQSADLPRFYESVRERSWFLEHFPEFVVPLPCIMPLYKTASRSPLLMAAALGANHLLSLHRNRGLAERHRLPAGGLITGQQVRERLEFVEPQGLVKGAVWYDALVTEPQRLLIELLRWATQQGVSAVNYAEVVEVRVREGAVSGLTARCANSGEDRHFKAAKVINATGHWSLDLATRLGAPIEPAPRLSWAWNVLFDIPNRSDSAAAVSSRRPDAQMFFVMPWQGRTLIGTGHALVGERDDPTKVPEKQIAEFIDAVDDAVPSLGVNRSRVARLFSGCLPAAAADRLELTNRPLIVNHAKHGFAGLYSLWGIKYTTSRALAQRVLRTAFGKEFTVPASASRAARPPSLVPSIAHAALPGEPVSAGDLSTAQIADLVRLAEQTGVQHLDDLVLRRCGLGDFPDNARELATIVAAHLPWTAERRRAEIQSFTGIE